MIPLLPKWHLHGNRPTFYDADAVTMLELASTLHGSMNNLITEYNKFVDATNKTIADFISGEIESREVFEVAIRQEFQDFIDAVELKIDHQDKEIEELYAYIKSNLAGAINDILSQMKESGELDEAIIDSLTELGNEVVELGNEVTVLDAGLVSVNKIITGIRRKINSHTNTIRNLVHKDRNKCEFIGPSTDGRSMKFTCSVEDEMRTVAILIDSEGTDKFEIAFLSNFRIKNLFTTGTAEKTLLGVWVDGKKYASFEDVRVLTGRFHTLVVAYTVACDGYTINVCYTINAYGITVYEAVPEEVEESPLLADTLRTTSNTTYFPVFTPTSDHAVFSISGSGGATVDNIYIETVTTNGKSVVKKIDFAGGL